MNKYRNKKVTIDGITFDSKKEGNRYLELKLLEKAGLIYYLRLHPSFQICHAVDWNGKKLQARYYIADFGYTENGEMIIEDVKGIRTQTYSLKRSLFLSQYPQYIFKEI